jgi:ribosomal protein L11 methyltransferase
VQADCVDVESVAVRATRENAERNGVERQIAVELGKRGRRRAVQGTYDVVIANIIARILIDLSAALVSQTRPGGSIVLAGIIQQREHEVIKAFTDRGAAVVTRRQMDDWVSLVLTDRPDGMQADRYT